MLSIALSGGAFRGHSQAGGLVYLYEQQIPVNVVVGTSVGALNGALFAQGDALKLAKLWHDLHKSQIFKHWLIPYLPWLWKGGLYNTYPLRKMIRDNVNPSKLRDSKVKYVCCSVNHNTREKIYTEDIDRDLLDFIYASASYPVAFPPLKHNGYVYEDGGTQEPIPVKKVVELAPKTDKILVMITPQSPVKNDLRFNGPELAFSTVKNAMEEVQRNDIDKGQRFWKDERFVIHTTPDHSSGSFDDRPEVVQRSFKEGYQRMRELHEKGKLT